MIFANTCNQQFCYNLIEFVVLSLLFPFLFRYYLADVAVAVCVCVLEFNDLENVFMQNLYLYFELHHCNSSKIFQVVVRTIQPNGILCVSFQAISVRKYTNNSFESVSPKWNFWLQSDTWNRNEHVRFSEISVSCLLQIFCGRNFLELLHMTHNQWFKFR